MSTSRDSWRSDETPGPNPDRHLMADVRPIVRVATSADRQKIYRSRHDVYALELAQHPTNEQGILTNDLDEYNVYVVAVEGDALVGYISVTPPGHVRYSLDGYLPRADWPFAPSDSLYELRLLTVPPTRRGTLLASTLMYAALRYIEVRHGQHIMATGRQEVASIYRRIGLADHGITIQSGQVTYLLMSGPVARVRAVVDGMVRRVNRIERMAEWDMAEPFRP